MLPEKALGLAGRFFYDAPSGKKCSIGKYFPTWFFRLRINGLAFMGSSQSLKK
jgi:hypothetical protein